MPRSYPLAVIFICALCAGQPAALVHHRAEEIAAKEKDLPAKVDAKGLAFAVLERTPTTVTGLLFRAKTGDAELHEQMADFVLVRSGRATLIVGGELRNPRKVGEGEFAAPSILSGEKRALNAGDLVHIPPKVPHHFVVDEGHTFSYILVKARE